eukprot:GHVL01039225.1.p1 GENE.GHVL01039225.1~~GHVL01039225.1.p1  ORF type:complete len:240 (-),score=68.23 GHVL01039225.1:100-819(-)
MLNMEKYRAVPRPKATVGDMEIRVSSRGRIGTFVDYATRVLNEVNNDHVIIRSTGNAISRAVLVAEMLKRRVDGLYQITQTSCTQIIDIYEPLEDGLERVEEIRVVVLVEIILSKTKPEADAVQNPPSEDQKKLIVDPPSSRNRGGRRGPTPRNAMKNEAVSPVSDSTTATSEGKRFGNGRGRGRGRGRRGGRGGGGRGVGGGEGRDVGGGEGRGVGVSEGREEETGINETAPEGVAAC